MFSILSISSFLSMEILNVPFGASKSCGYQGAKIHRMLEYVNLQPFIMKTHKTLAKKSVVLSEFAYFGEELPEALKQQSFEFHRCSCSYFLVPPAQAQSLKVPFGSSLLLLI